MASAPSRSSSCTAATRCLDLRLFRNARFSAASLAVAGAALLPLRDDLRQTQMLQFVLGYDPLGAGIRTVPFALILLVVANATPRRVRWPGPATSSPPASRFSLSMFERTLFDAHTGYDIILLSQSVSLSGWASRSLPPRHRSWARCPPEHAGVGSAVNDTTRQVGGALGVAVMGSIGAAFYRSTLARKLPAGVSRLLAEFAGGDAGHRPPTSHRCRSGPERRRQPGLRARPGGGARRGPRRRHPRCRRGVGLPAPRHARRRSRRRLSRSPGRTRRRARRCRRKRGLGDGAVSASSTARRASASSHGPIPCTPPRNSRT